VETKPGAIPAHYLYPCTLFAHREEHIVSTVLGSCVAVCEPDALLLLETDMEILHDRCTRCGACRNVCPSEAIVSE